MYVANTRIIHNAEKNVWLKKSKLKFVDEIVGIREYVIQKN